MDANYSHDPDWDIIDGITQSIIQQVHSAENNSLLAQLDLRNQNIRNYFHKIEQHPKRLQNIEQRIANLLALDERIISSCRALQAEVMVELHSARRAKLGIKVYAASQHQDSSFGQLPQA